MALPQNNQEAVRGLLNYVDLLEALAEDLRESIGDANWFSVLLGMGVLKDATAQNFEALFTHLKSGKVVIAEEDEPDGEEYEDGDEVSNVGIDYYLEGD